MTPLSATSKILQLVSIVRSGDAGVVSAPTYAMGTYSSLGESDSQSTKFYSLSSGMTMLYLNCTARIVTLLMTHSDVYLMLVPLQGASLSFALCVAAIVYKKSPQSTPSRQPHKKKKKKQ